MSFSRKFRRAHRTSPSSQLLSLVRPEFWDINMGSTLDEWDTLTNDWFIYTVDQLEGFSTRSTQLLANRDGTYFLIRSPEFLREPGVFTSEQKQIVESLFTPDKIQAYMADSLGPVDRLFTASRRVLHNALWIVPGQASGAACWGESNLTPATEQLIATFEQLLVTLGVNDADSEDRSPAPGVAQGYN
jgi:hypothetical protein